MMPADATLLINLSAGDADYAYLTVKALTEAHRSAVKEAIIVVDTVHAQFSSFYDHGKRYSEPKYSENIQKIITIANQLKNEGLADRVIMLKNQHDSIGQSQLRYLGNQVRETHDFRGAPIAAYIAGIEACCTKYVVHYDGDIILHQLPGSDWILQGIQHIEKEKHIIAVSPRPAPGLLSDPLIDLYDDVYWFSTRCLLIDKQSLMAQLPLITNDYRLEVLLRKLMRRTYPPAFETMLTHKLKSKKLQTRYLLSVNAWFIHPENKGLLFLRLLPDILSNVKDGQFPVAQEGDETLNVEAWNSYLNQ